MTDMLSMAGGRRAKEAEGRSGKEGQMEGTDDVLLRFVSL